MTTLFISDLHLEASQARDRRSSSSTFSTAKHATAEALYILGDLFESWVGDDDPNPHYADIKIALRELVDSRRARLFHARQSRLHDRRTVCRGNRRDILDDPTLIELYGRQCLAESWRRAVHR